MFLLACSVPFSESTETPEMTEATSTADTPTWAPEEALPGATADRSLLINELMPDNDSTVMDEAGEFADWIELVASVDVDTTGWSIAEGADVVPLPTRQMFAGERWLLFADGDLGDDHLPFGIGAGETLRVIAPDGTTADEVDIPELDGDVAWGRFPDGGALRRSTVYPTPGYPNPIDPGMESDPSALLFPDEEVLRIDLNLSELSLEALRANAYSYAQGGLGFEGAYLWPVGVRIKGQLGSARSIDQKCALHIGLDEYVPGARLRGLEHLTLNSMVQDPSFVHERLTYTLFRHFDVPAPRIGYTELYINNDLRGLYLNVESQDDAFLARWFGSGDGNLYEGAYGPDVTEGSYTGLQLDRDGDDVEPYTELAVLAGLLSQTPSEELVAELESLVDLERALAMWAVEVVTGHWDGYFYYPNNYRIYHDPTTGLLTLLPWGTDQTWGWMGDPHSPSGGLARWALQIPSVRNRYDIYLWEVSEAVEALGLADMARTTWADIEPHIEADPYKEIDAATAEAYLRSTVDYLEYNPSYVLGILFPDGAP